MEEKRLTDDDVYTLIGHAEGLRMDGQSDMPKYLFDLAERIALAIGDRALGERASELAKKVK